MPARGRAKNWYAEPTRLEPCRTRAFGRQRQRWPRLLYMAINILSIPAMSDEPERVFSGARRTISWERGQMEPETLKMTECLKHWKRSGILDVFLKSEDE